MKALLFAFGYGMLDSPVSRVVALLKELQGRIQNDEKLEQNVYNKYACWCETTTDRKAQVIKQAREDIGTDGLKVLELKAKVSRLTSEIKKATIRIVESERSLSELTKMREKNHANYLAIKAEMEQAIEALGKAMQVLAGAGTRPALLQAPELVALSATLNRVISLGNLSAKEVALAQSLVNKFTPTAADGSGSYSPQSATIIGILKNMHESFNADLKEATGTEEKQVEQFEKATEKLRYSITLLQEEVQNKRTKQAEAETSLADTDQRLLDTTEQLDEDVKFFDTTKEACTGKAKAWKTRQDLRHEELEGIGEALKILTSEENRALFAKSIKPGLETFLQESRAPRSRAFTMVERVAKSTHSLRLAAVAAAIRTGHFDAVIKQIEKIIEEMKHEEQTDIENRDNCITDRHRLNEENAKDKHSKKVSENKIAQKERKIEANNLNIEQNVVSIKDATKDLKELTSQREQENADFKQAKTDDETAIGLLEQVIGHLSAFYKNNAGAGTLEATSLIQEPEFKVSEDQAPEAKFSKKGSREGESKGIISLLTMITQDLRNEVSNGIKDEEASQKAFEKQRDAIDKVVDALGKKNTSLKNANADRMLEINEETSNIETKDGEITATDEELNGLEKGCDWLVKNFDKRRDNRRSEHEALTNAKGVLAGAQVSLVAKHKFDDNELDSVQFTSLSFLQKKY
eukprot:GEMP01012561.1.p1 GENE.GEMP01012561.1~~GEMP01012561.1.p1  ORF type:complete len:693 (+),score=207.22 GEMP01012561.1:484-2562(+)